MSAMPIRHNLQHETLDPDQRQFIDLRPVDLLKRGATSCSETISFFSQPVINHSFRPDHSSVWLALALVYRIRLRCREIPGPPILSFYPAVS